MVSRIMKSVCEQNLQKGVVKHRVEVDEESAERVRTRGNHKENGMMGHENANCFSENDPLEYDRERGPKVKRGPEDENLDHIIIVAEVISY